MLGCVGSSHQMTQVFGPLKKHLGGHRCQSDVEAPKAALQWVHLQNTQYCAEGTHSLICVVTCINVEVTLWKSMSLFSFLVRKVILKNKLLNNKIFITILTFPSTLK
jgi:hypothetical protein